MLCVILLSWESFEVCREESCPGPPGDGKGHHYSTLMTITLRENTVWGQGYSKLFSTSCRVQWGKKEFTQVGSASTNKQTHAHTYPDFIYKDI